MEELTYKKFLYAMNQIAEKVKIYGNNSIFGIPRGGLVPAVYLSHLTGLPLVDFIEKEDKPLIIDDIIDSGKTLEPYYKEGYTIASIYYHKQSVFEPVIWVYEKKDDWIKFPWETNETTKSKSLE